MPDKKNKDAKQARPLVVEDQTSFVDEDTRTGKQFSSSRKVTDLEHVGAIAPDVDPDEDPESPTRGARR